EEGITKKQNDKRLEITQDTVDHVLNELSFDYEHEGRGMLIMQSNDAFHLTTKPEHSHYCQEIHQDNKSSRMSQAALETLAIIAYRQPSRKVEIEELRGAASDHAARSGVQRSLIERSGREDAPGRPYFFKTTSAFLTYFGLSSLNDLPALPDDIDTAGAEYELDLFQ